MRRPAEKHCRMPLGLNSQNRPQVAVIAGATQSRQHFSPALHNHVSLPVT